MEMKNDRTFHLALTGMFTALVIVTTMMIRIPMPYTFGYVHMGDAMIFLSVLVLGKKAGSFAAGAGSALADLFSGYAYYAPWTLVIKALMALVMGLALEHMKKRGVFGESGHIHLTELLAMSLAGLEMTAGYYIAASVMQGNWTAPLLSIPGNVAQFTVGMVIAWLLSASLAKTPVRKYLV